MTKDKRQKTHTHTKKHKKNTKTNKQKTKTRKQSASGCCSFLKTQVGTIFVKFTLFRS